jgi:hypothetical protein
VFEFDLSLRHRVDVEQKQDFDDDRREQLAVNIDIRPRPTDCLTRRRMRTPGNNEDQQVDRRLAAPRQRRVVELERMSRVAVD